MGKDRIALAICFCLIVALAGFSGWLYLGAKGLESKVNDLESKTSSLEAQNAELIEQVQNLTDWRDALEATEQVDVEHITWTDSTHFTIQFKNYGTATVTIDRVTVNGASKTTNATLPESVPAGTRKTYLVTFTWTAGDNYDIAVVTSKGNAFTKRVTGGVNY